MFHRKDNQKKVKEIQNNQEQKPQSKRFFKKGVVGYATRSRFTFFCLFGEKCQYLFFIFLDCDIHRIAAVKKNLITTISREYICSGDYHADSTWDTLIKNSTLLTFSITLCVLKHALRVKNSI